MAESKRDAELAVVRESGFLFRAIVRAGSLSSQAAMHPLETHSVEEISKLAEDIATASERVDLALRAYDRWRVNEG